MPAASRRAASRRAASRRPDPAPYRPNDYAPVIAGTLAWLVAVVVLLARHDEMARNGQGWWLWVAVVGFALGFWGMTLVAVHHRVAARRAERHNHGPDDE
jgi:hypothetical protein